MATMRKVKRSIASAVLVWIGRRMLGRVQKQTMKSITRKPKAASQRSASAKRIVARRLTRKNTTTVVPPVSRRAGRTTKGIAFALLSAAAVAALKVGVDHVIETEREQQVVIPDFDVFADDDE